MLLHGENDGYRAMRHGADPRDEAIDMDGVWAVAARYPSRPIPALGRGWHVRG
jgi:hypothetical protein